MSNRLKAMIGCLGLLIVAIAVPFLFTSRSSALFQTPGVSLPHENDGPKSASLEAVDQILAGLKLANIVFNTPGSIPLGESHIIHLILSTKETVENLQALIEASGEKVSAQIRVGNEMEARLTGKGFKIQAITPETQAVSGVEKTDWKWEIEPTEGGKQRLHLTMSAILTVEGKQVPRVIRTFERNIEIEVTWSRQVADFVANNWQWLWATILVPVAGWGIQRKISKGQPAPTQADKEKS